MLKKALSNSIYYLVFLCLILAVIVVPKIVGAQNNKSTLAASSPIATSPSTNSPAVMPQATVTTVNTAVHPITQAAVQGGVLACTSRINQVSKFLTANAQSGADLIFAPNLPDQHIFSASLEIIPANSPSAYVTTSFAPTTSGGCDAVYDSVQFMPLSCTDVAVKRFKVNRYSALLKKNIYVLNAGAVKFFLMPAGDAGCVVIKKEVVQ